MTFLVTRLTASLVSVLLWLSASSLAQPAHAGAQPSATDAAVQGQPPTPAQGLTLDLDSLIRITGLPPAPASQALHDDLAILRWLQAHRTPQMVAATWMTLARDPVLFSPALGVDMSKSTPRIEVSLRQFLALVDEAADQIKRRVHRPRPYASHPDLKPCLPPESGFSFPSGHSTWYTTAALLLADLVPERRERLEQMGLHGAANRVMCGVHYPSDIQAARRLAHAAAAQIIASPQWQRFRLDPAVQAEVAGVRQARPEALPLLVP